MYFLFIANGGINQESTRYLVIIQTESSVQNRCIIVYWIEKHFQLEWKVRTATK